MKSKNQDIATFLIMLLALIRVSEIWKNIRNNVASALESVIDRLSPEAADRILSLTEILDQLLLIFENKVEMIDG